MDGPMSGDIFPAKQAIEMIDQVDLSLPIEIPPVPGEAEPDNVPAEEHRALLAEIAELKKPDLNSNDLGAAIKMVEGTARSMGIDVVG